jgi:hypothetical protein
MKGLSARKIHEGLADMIRPEAVAYSILTRDFRTVKYARQSEEVPPEAELMRTDPVEGAIVKPLTNNPFSSVRDLS